MTKRRFYVGFILIFLCSAPIPGSGQHVENFFKPVGTKLIGNKPMGDFWYLKNSENSHTLHLSTTTGFIQASFVPYFTLQDRNSSLYSPKQGFFCRQEWKFEKATMQCNSSDFRHLKLSLMRCLLEIAGLARDL